MSKERAELARCAEESEKQSEYEGGLLDRIAELEEELFKQSQESKEEVSRAIEIILEKDAKISELETVLKKLLDVTLWVDSGCKKLGAAEQAARETPKEQVK